MPSPAPPPLPPADSSGASWPAPRRGPRGCQAGRAPARPPNTKRLCGARRGLARGQAASGKSRELGEGRRTQGGAPSSARAVAPPSARANQPSQPRRLNTTPAPPPNPLPTLSLYPAHLPILGDPPPHLSPAFLSLLVPLHTPAPLTLTHPGAIFRPPSFHSRTSPILGSFPRQPWPSPPGVGGWVCMWEGGEGIWGHRVGELRRGPRQGREQWVAGVGCLSGSINRAREFRACLLSLSLSASLALRPRPLGRPWLVPPWVAIGVSVWAL